VILRLLKIYILVFPFVIQFNAYSQEISTIGENEPFALSGNINIDQMFTSTLGTAENYGRKPYAYFLTGGLNASFYGISMPFNFSYSNQKLGYTHPFTFNQFGIQPSYKWLKVFVGYNSFSFSPYTMNGHQFCGGGVEVSPKDFPLSFSVIYGRLLKAVEFSDTVNTIPAYRRLGAGGKIGFTSKKVNVSTSVFYAWDEANSNLTIPDSLEISPKDNLSLGLQANLKVIKGVDWDISFGNSIVTDDIRSPFAQSRKFLLGAYSGRESSQAFYAYKSGLNYAINNGSVGVAVERIQPNFQTLGAYYSTNDFENLTLNATNSFMGGKVNVSGNFGVQRDNLNNEKLFTSQRGVGALNISATIREKLNANLSFSTFNSYTNVRSVFDVINATSPYQNLDTLNFTQVNQTGSMSLVYTTGGESAKNSFTLNVSGNTSETKQGVTMDKPMLFINSGIGHSYSVTSTKLAINSSMFYSGNTSPMGKSETFGPMLSVSKPFLEDKIRLTITGAINKSWLDGKQQSFNGNTRFSGAWTPIEGHRVSLTGGFSMNRSFSGAMPPRKELIFSLQYSYSFSKKNIFKQNEKQPKKDE
jgi:hypothetical protein